MGVFKRIKRLVSLKPLWIFRKTSYCILSCNMILQLTVSVIKFKPFFFQVIEWRYGPDENSFSPVHKVFELLSFSGDNSSIHFRPFPSNKYSSKIHSTFYQCFAINSVGVISSPVIDVRAGDFLIFTCGTQFL